ncbi:RnfABCDGE type electron transport complex subunit B [Candidatus Formimonas warabiya]|uniref:Ion-translocating oxidoreductase complex subunit B n=1 Tax=Formimonas warabiya TaxID=1761012 RepID=A0A3G1KTV5_FORW1|nr:Fe-S cluster domain-containing protein [Candidatus Formimonas warabiya]ATW25898.1 RnfABCDGE type electron transport complex subunit B [Candidatus Formimonas warabiya]
MNTSILILIVMTAIGLCFGLILAFGNKKLAIEMNPLIHIVEDALPKGQCGACGYAGCLAYAEAVVLDPDVPPNMCIPGKEKVAKIVAELTGKTAEAVEPRIAQVKCAGSHAKAVINYNYDGVQDCVAANLLLGGPKSCKYGCLGLATCVKNCPFDAMTMSPDGLPVIDPNKCTGCGKCETVCPRHVISMLNLKAHVRVNCNSKDKGPVAKKACTVACIGCSRCAKDCQYGAIKIENNLAVVDTHVCLEKCDNATCLAKCPTGAIKPAVFGIVPGTEGQESIDAICKVCAPEAKTTPPPAM